MNTIPRMLKRMRVKDIKNIRTSTNTQMLLANIR